jgi:hypothetical protein
MEVEEQEASRTRSAAIFGNRYFAEVVMAVSRLSGNTHARVTTRMVASETALSDSLVRQVMSRLSNADLITELPRAGGARSPRYFQIRPGPLWARVLDACAAAGEGGGTVPASG